jgi:hypothetical protein
VFAEQGQFFAGAWDDTVCGKERRSSTERPPPGTTGANRQSPTIPEALLSGFMKPMARMIRSAGHSFSVPGMGVMPLADTSTFTVTRPLTLP